MSDTIPRFDNPELVFGFVAPIGSDLKSTVATFRTELEACGYRVAEVKVTKAYKYFEDVVPPLLPLEFRKTKERYETHIAYGNQLRTHFGDDSILAASSILGIQRQRLRVPVDDPTKNYQRVAYLVHQFKRREEVELFRTVYGTSFFQVSVYSRRGARVDELARQFAGSSNSPNYDAFRGDAEKIVSTDENENNAHGQEVSRIFHDADFIVNLDVAAPSVKGQVDRFCDIIFGSNALSPTHMEYGMFLAKAAALRTLDLSRQVGAAIFGETGEVITLGSNEVPKAGGGTYWSDEKFDDRDYVRNVDSNDQRKLEILRSLLEEVCTPSEVDAKITSPGVVNSQLMDALEYGRIVHAEMSAICDAARLGRPVKNATLYTTTFPCHMCAKHIVAAGVSRVVFLEPYPKSLASRLHSDSLSVEGADRGKYKDFPSVQFEHFYGVTPRRYRDLFARGKRKDAVGSFVRYAGGSKRPILDIRAPFYRALEDEIIKRLKTVCLEAHDALVADADA